MLNIEGQLPWSNTATSSVSKLVGTMVLLASWTADASFTFDVASPVRFDSSDKSLDFCAVFRCKTLVDGSRDQDASAFRHAADLPGILWIVRRALGGVSDDCVGADDPRLLQDWDNCRGDRQDVQRPLSMWPVHQDFRRAAERE